MHAQVYVNYAERILSVLPENLRSLPILEAAQLQALRLPPAPEPVPEPDLAAFGGKAPVSGEVEIRRVSLSIARSTADVLESTSHTVSASNNF